MSGLPVTYHLRPATREDWPWIAQTWVESIRGSGREQRKAEGGLWSPYWYGLVRTMLLDPRLVVEVATEGDALAGYAVTCMDVLHMVYVRKASRRSGIADALLRRSVLLHDSPAATCWTADLGQWMLEKYHLRYLPLYMMYPERAHGRNQEHRFAGQFAGL